MSESIAKLIDHSILHPTHTDEDTRKGCELARQYQTASICIKPYEVELAAKLLAGSGVPVCTVIGFPHGGQLPEVKAFETDLACQQGATEVDMVVNIGKVMQQDWAFVERDIQAVVYAAKKHGALVKVIFETDYVTDDALKVKLCQICEQLGVDYVKTSTGFGYVKKPNGDFNTTGATEHDVALMRKSTGPKVGVKASGGVRNYAQAAKMRELGATRIGTSGTESIVADERTAQGKQPAGKAKAGDTSGY